MTRFIPLTFVVPNVVTNPEKHNEFGLTVALPPLGIIMNASGKNFIIVTANPFGGRGVLIVPPLNSPNVMMDQSDDRKSF